MTTKIELRRDGSRLVFHRRGNLAWTHPIGRRGGYWSRRPDGSIDRRRGDKGWIELRCHCPVEATVKASQRPQKPAQRAGGWSGTTPRNSEGSTAFLRPDSAVEAK